MMRKMSQIGYCDMFRDSFLDGPSEPLRGPPPHCCAIGRKVISREFKRRDGQAQTVKPAGEYPPCAEGMGRWPAQQVGRALSSSLLRSNGEVAALEG